MPPPAWWAQADSACEPAEAVVPKADDAATDSAAGVGKLLLHATGIAFGPERGVVIIGASGTGKSTLALTLIAAGAQLLGDDRLHVFARDGALFARPPRGIAGLIEQRGLGIMRLNCLRLARLRLIIDLGEPEDRRLPPPERCRLCGVNLPCLRAPVTGAAGLASFPCAIRQYMSGAVRLG